jgi:hypothetical protein
MRTATQRKKPAQRAFKGLAGSPLAVVRKPLPVRANGRSLTLAIKISSEDDTLRSPRVSEEPQQFDPWIDVYGQHHAEIDLDCAFQQHAFDSYLGRGTSPNVDSGDNRSSSYGDEDEQIEAPHQDLGIDSKSPFRLRQGVLTGQRPVRPRRPTRRTWWILDIKFLREFIRTLINPDALTKKKRAAACRAVFVLVEYYHKNRQDQEICEDGKLFKSAKEVKQLRQYLVKKGLKLYGERKPLPRNGGHGANCWCGDCKQRVGVSWQDIRDRKDAGQLHHAHSARLS